MQILNIGVIKCDSSKADEMEPTVAAVITKAGLWGKIVGKVSDGGANLLKLRRALKKQGGCKAMCLKESYDGTCYDSRVEMLPIRIAGVRILVMTKTNRSQDLLCPESNGYQLSIQWNPFARWRSS